MVFVAWAFLISGLIGFRLWVCGLVAVCLWCFDVSFELLRVCLWWCWVFSWALRFVMGLYNIVLLRGVLGLFLLLVVGLLVWAGSLILW